MSLSSATAPSWWGLAVIQLSQETWTGISVACPLATNGVNGAQPFDLDIVSENLDSHDDYFTTRGSGFLLEAIHRFVLCITPYRPLVGSSYIPTPKFLADKNVF